MSYHKLNTKPLNASLKTLLKRGGRIGLGISAFTPVLALANPTGGQVVGGQATIATPSANGTVITQTSQSAIINWQQFNIGAGQYVQFLQPSSSSVVLNRVIGGSPSSILGSLTANGQVFLVNTNGVYFGKGASIDTQGFLASTLGITDQNFLAHNYVFDEAGAPGAEIVNDGNITAHHSGYVVLAGDYAENDGVIAAQSGHVILASGSKATLSLSGNSLINFAVSQATLASYAGVKNTGSILADGGTVIMTADVANLLKATVVNNTGLVEAHAISDKGGDIYLTASGGNIENAGTLDVSATRSGQAGGDVTLKGDERTTLTSTSNIDATGESANGGSVEVSGNTLALRGLMKIGKGGKLLMDPGSIELVSTSTANNSIHSLGNSADTLSIGHVGVKYIQKQLNSGVAVDLVAVRNISAAGSVHAINATGKGSLDLAATNGAIKLAGVSITIAGKLVAQAYSHASFGFIQAGTASLAVNNGDIELLNAKGSSHGGIARYSAKTTTGALTITANHVGVHSGGSGEVGIGLGAKTALTVDANIGSFSSAFGNNVTLMGAAVKQTGTIITNEKFSAAASAGDADIDAVTAKAGATITAAGGNIHLDGSLIASSGAVVITDKKGVFFAAGTGTEVVSGDQAVTINVKHIEDSGASRLVLQAGATGTLTVDGLFGANTAAGFGHNLVLSGHDIDVNNNIKASQLSIFGTHLAYTGKNTTFSLAASTGDMRLAASIGSAAAPVNYNVNMVAKGHDVDIERSIYTGNTASGAAANITATQTFGSLVAGQHGVHVGDSASTAITLSAKGSVTLTGANVLIGQTDASSQAGAIAITAKNITFTANGPQAHSGNVLVQAGRASASNGLLDRSITLHANGNIAMTGKQVQILGGRASAHLAASAGYASDLADVTLSAKGNVTLKGATSASGGVLLRAGQIGAIASSLNAAATHSVDVEANVSITAGKAVSLTAEHVDIAGGNAHSFSASAEHAGSDVTVSASAKTTLKAGTNITLTGGSDSHGSVKLYGASETGRDVNILASAANAKATVAVDTGVSLTAGGAIAVSGHQVFVSAGSAAGDIQGGQHPDVVAVGAGAIASADIAANVAFTGGVGGIAILGKGTNGSVEIRGGSQAGENQEVVAGSGGNALTSVQAHVDLTTTGNLTVNATGNVRIHAGEDGASHAIASADSGVASVKADNGVSLSGKTVTASAGSVLFIGSGERGAYQAVATAKTGATASVDAEANISLTATGGAITLRGKKYVTLEAGYGLASGSIDRSAHVGSSHSIAGGGVSHSTISNILHGVQANALSSGAQATVKASATVNLTATGAISLTQTGTSGSILVTGGSRAGFGAVPAASNGGHATVNVLDGVNIAAGGAVSLKGKYVLVTGGRAGGVNASSSKVVHTHHCIASGCSAGTGGNTSFVSHHATALGAGAVSQFDTDGSITVKGSSIAVSGTNLVLIFAGALAGSGARAKTDGGSVAESHKSGVDLTATGAITLAGTDAAISAGYDAGLNAHASASGDGVADIAVDASVNINAATMSVTAGKFVELRGGGSAGYGAVAVGRDGKANVTANAALDITVVNAFSAKLTGSSHGTGSQHGEISLIAGQGAVHDARGFGTSGQGSVTAHGDLDLTVTGSKGSITLDTGKDLKAAIAIGAGGSGGNGGRFAILDADGNTGTATVTGTADADLSAKGTISLQAGGSIHVFAASRGQAESASVGAGFGGKAKLSDSASVNISGGTVSLAAGGSASILGGGRNIGSHAKARPEASGSASVVSESNVNLTATGTLSITAGDNLSVIAAGASHGRGAVASITTNGKNAKSNVDIESNITLTGSTAVSLSAKDRVLVAGNFASNSSARAGSGAKVSAGSHDTATITDNENVSVVTKGAFSAVGKDVLLAGGSEVGYGVVVGANGPGAKATFTAGGTVNVSAASVKISAARVIEIEGGSGAGARSGPTSANIHAAHGGSANLDAAAGVNIIAGTAFSAKLTGTSNSGALIIEAGDGAGDSGGLQALTNGHANLNAAAGVSVDVTGKGGTLTLNTGKSPNAIRIRGGDYALAGLIASASTAATAVGVASADVKLSALGAITFTAADSNLSIEAGHDIARNASVHASHAGHATLTATGDVDITGGALTLTAQAVRISGGQTDDAFHMHVNASNGGSANADVGASVNLQAVTGGIKITATTGSVFVLAAGQGAGSLISVNAGANAKAAATLTNNVTLAAASTIAVSAKIAVAFSADSDSDAAGVHVQAAHGATAAAALSENISITAGGAFTATAGGAMFMIGAGTESFAKHADVTATGGRASASLTEDGSLSITAQSIAASASGLEIGGGSRIGRFASVNANIGGAAALKVNGGVSLDATGGSIAIKGKKNLDIFGGHGVGAGSSHTFHGSHNSGTTTGGNYNHVTSHSNAVDPTQVKALGANASAKYSVDASVNLTATGAITLTQTNAASGNVSVAAGGSVGARARTSANDGLASFSATANVNLTAGGAVSIKGFDVKVIGGHAAGRGAGRTSHGTVTSLCTAGHSCNTTGVHSFTSHGNPVTATGVNGHAALNANAGVNLTGAAVSLTAAGDMLLAAGGNSAGGHASIVAVNSGSAAVTVHTGIKITTPGAFTATAGGNLRITANSASVGGDLGADANLLAQGGGAHAGLTASNEVQINAKSVALKATAGSLSIAGGNSIGSHIRVHAGSSADQVTATLSGTVDITAATTVSLSGQNVRLSGGNSGGKSADLRAWRQASSSAVPMAAPFASVALTADGSLNFTAGGALTVKAAHSFDARAGAFGAESTQVFAYGSSAIAKLDAKADVNIIAASLTATAGSSIDFGAGFHAGIGAFVDAAQGARAELDLDAGVNVTTTGAVTLTATKGDVFIVAGSGSFVDNAPRAAASNGGTTILDEQVNTSINAGTTLTIKAGGNVTVAGGNGLFGSAVATLGFRNIGSSTPASVAGVVDMTISGVTALKAGSNLSVTAGGTLQVLGGSANGMAINLFPSAFHHSLGSVSAGPAGGKANGQLAAGVSLTAGGNTNLQAGNDLTVAAGAGVTLAVGMTRVTTHTGSGQGFVGKDWGGGSANLTGDVSATVTAGQDLTVTAGAGGAGDLQVEGLRPDPVTSNGSGKGFFNVAAVRGGSSNANAVVSLTGNATLNAGNDLIVNAKGNASIVGGSLATLRADHTRGNITITGSADATLHAGHDVVLNNITGSLTVAGINANPSHMGAVFVAASGSTGHTVVTGHADALISAGNDVRTVKALGKGFNVVGGNDVEVVALGDDSVANFATGTANANVIAGGSVTVTAKGDLNVLGGEGGKVSAGAKGSASHSISGATIGSGHHFGSRVAKLSATAGITAKGAVAINATGSGVVAGGDGLKAVASFSYHGNPSHSLGAFGLGEASGNVSAGITAGTTLSLTIGKSLLVRGGSADKASAVAAFVFETGAQAAANSKVSLISGGDMTLNVGLTTHGDASFVAGSGASAKTLIIGSHGSAQAATHVDMDLQTGSNLTLNVGGNLVVAGGPATELGSFTASSHFKEGAEAFGSDVTAKTAVTAHATFTVGGNLTATLHGGDATIEAGGSVAAQRAVIAQGSNNSASLTADAGITVGAGGAIKVSGVGTVGVLAGALFNGSAPAFSLSDGGGPVHVTTVSSVKISGKGVNINGGHNVTISPSSPATFSSGGIKMDGTVSITSTAGAPVLSVSPLTVRAPQSMQDGVRLVPMTSTTGFGGAQPMSFMPTTDAIGAASLWTVPVSSTQGAVHTMSQTVALDTLQSQALVVSLVTVLAPAALEQVLTGSSQPVLFSPGDLTAEFVSRFPSSCGTVLQKDAASDALCKTGGR